jgi:hypothetical protein
MLEDAGGEPLDRLLAASTEAGPFLYLGIAIAAVLGKLHQHGLIPQGRQAGQHPARGET